MKAQENNKMIAEFMGLSIKEGVCYYTDEDDMFPMGIEVEEPYIPYDEDWNWLMPVIIKMADAREDTHYKLYKTIDEAYEEVVEFINQYNNNESTD